MTETVHAPNYDPIVTKLLNRLMDLEAEKARNAGAEAQYGESGANQADFRGAHGVVLQIDNGKYMAVIVVSAALCGLCAAVSWWTVSSARDNAVRYREDYLYTQDEFQKERNHVIELEARLKIIGDEVQELKHVR